jgi:diguanylate cyclase (GGDEF)-like protein
MRHAKPLNEAGNGIKYMKRNYSKLIRYLNYFIHERDRHDAALCDSIRRLAFIYMLLASILFLADIYFIAFSTANALTILLAVSICSFVAAAFLSTLYYVKFYGNYAKTVNLSIFLMTTWLLIGICVSGGPVKSPVIPLLYVPTVLAFFLLGQSSGLWWAVIVLVGIGISLAMERQGLSFIDTVRPETEIQIRFTIFLIGYSATLGLVSAYEFINKQLKHDLEIEHQRYIFLANHDRMTMLANRASFEENFKQRLFNLKTHAPETFLALLYIDLNGFKPINDTYGHRAGDMVLRSIAVRLKASLRNTDLVARQGGDEFLVMLNKLQNSEMIEPIVVKILETLEEPILFETHKLSVSASIGIAIYPTHGSSLDELLIHSDIAMYAAKKQGLGWAVYHSGINHRR